MKFLVLWSISRQSKPDSFSKHDKTLNQPGLLTCDCDLLFHSLFSSIRLSWTYKPCKTVSTDSGLQEFSELPHWRYNFNLWLQDQLNRPSSRLRWRSNALWVRISRSKWLKPPDAETPESSEKLDNLLNFVVSQMNQTRLIKKPSTQWNKLYQTLSFSHMRTAPEFIADLLMLWSPSRCFFLLRLRIPNQTPSEQWAWKRRSRCLLNDGPYSSYNSSCFLILSNDFIQHLLFKWVSCVTVFRVMMNI